MCVGQGQSYYAREAGGPLKSCGRSGRVLTWKLAAGNRVVTARLAAGGFQGPGLKEGVLETSGCVSPRPALFRAASSSVLREQGMQSLGIRTAFLQADYLNRDVYLRAPLGWNPRGSSVIEYAGSRSCLERRPGSLFRGT